MRINIKKEYLLYTRIKYHQENLIQYFHYIFLKLYQYNTYLYFLDDNLFCYNPDS